MNKKFFVVPIILSGLLVAGLSFKNTDKSILANDEIIFDVDAIQALSHKDGATVNFVNSDIKEYWDTAATDINKLRNLYEMNSEIASFGSNSFDNEYVRELYAKWDDFKPVNNTLSWKSNVNATSFDIVVSLDAELTKAVYEETNLAETSYTMVNPFANTHYYWQVTAHTSRGDVKSTIFDFYSGDYKRTVDIPTISNTRDVGGFTSQFGTMKQGLIYRSGRLDDFTEGGRSALNQLDIQTDLDLRNNGEGSRNPARLTNYYLKTLQTYYNNFNDTYRPALIDAVRVFTEPANYPIMFHCAVGRDRTGTLAMILQALCGADKEYIIHDYYTSMWSVTGAYQKEVNELNLQVVNDTLTQLENFGNGSLLTGVENYLKEQMDPTTHQMVGLTKEEITSIRDIWSGKTEVEHAPKTFVARENYQGKAFVRFKAVGHKDVAMMIVKGDKVKAPYQLDSGYAWYSNGQIFDFDTSVYNTTFIYADISIQYIVTIHFAGISKQDETIRANYGDVISLDRYVLNGFDMIAISDEGREISSLTVYRDTYINIVYVRI